MTANATPPRWAELGLRAFLNERNFECVSGDLLEEYRESIYVDRGAAQAISGTLRRCSGLPGESVPHGQ